MDKEQRDIFISYTKDDLETAKWLVTKLEAQGLKVYYQDRDFLAGESFPNDMRQAQQLTKHTVAIVSRTYLASHHAMSEYDDALALNKRQPRRLIPVRIDDCDLESVRPALNFFDLGSARTDEAALALLRHITGRPQPPTHLTQHAFLQHLDAGKGEVFSVAFSAQRRWIAAGSFRKVLLWDRSDLRKPPQKLKGPANYVYSVAFSRDGTHLACGGEDKLVWVWNLASGGEPQSAALKKEHTDAVYSVAFSADGDRLVSAGYDRQLNLWNVRRSSLERKSDSSLNLGRLTSVAFAPDDNQCVAFGSLDNCVRLWNTKNGRVMQLGAHDSSVEGVAFSPDGRRLASCGLDKAVRVWDAAAARRLWTSSSSNERYELWRDIRPQHEYLVRSVAFSPDGGTIASAGWDKTLKLWDAENGDCLVSIPVGQTDEEHWHTDWVWSVAFDPEGTMLATGGSDGKVLLWQVS